MAKDHAAADHTRPTDATRQAEVESAGAKRQADREPTPEEELAAEGLSSDESVRQHYQEMAERGAKQKGEGRIAG
ncbi:MAG TPA: hypothetical protein VE990_19140 [Acidimicrobiales bacterium]|nr:hypothetical protein [Acidimicrobiales bacterium]